MRPLSRRPAGRAGTRRPDRETEPSRRTGPLWLAVHFPWIAGEVLLPGGTRQPAVVCEETRRGWLVYRASPEARRQGVAQGMTISAASVICPGLLVRQRRPRHERRRLAEMGDRMLRFSPVVSVQAPETVLLEIRGSLGLFGGLERLRAHIEQALEAAGHAWRLAGAPAPAAARQLARWGRDRIVADRSALRSALGDMPAGLLDLDGKTRRRLAQAGIRTLRDLWRLPADGLARRFGPGLARELDRLRGGFPDPQPLHESPLHDSSVLMLDWATDDLAQIETAVGYLLRSWVAELRRSARGTSGFSIQCLPEQGDDMLQVDIDMRRVSRDLDHLQMLASERLGPLAGDNHSLFDVDDRADGEAAAQWQQIEELLATRWGQGMNALVALSDHRPERAWRPGLPETSCRDVSIPRAHRPLWLLDPPRPLPWPACSSRLGDHAAAFKGPERIETGWWDRHDQRRDYYAATDHQGRRLWVFWDLRHERWYLHGLFA
jgi:protein ImuB